MKKMYGLLIAVGFTAIMITNAAAQTTAKEKIDRVYASYLLAFGRPPVQGEINYWSQFDISVKDIAEKHRQYLQNNESEKRQMIKRSFKHAYGRYPNETEIQTNLKLNWHYTDWMNNHVAWLRKTPSDYNEAIKNAYKEVMGREPQSSEYQFWKSKTPSSFAYIASCVENCKRTSGSSSICANNVLSPSSSYVSQSSVAPKIFNEAAAVVAAGGANVVAAGGGNVVAAGGGNVVAAGGLN